MTRIFFDTEFTGLRQDTTLMSIGLVSDCGATFYAEANDYNLLQVTPWIEENVISQFGKASPYKTGRHTQLCASTGKIALELHHWLGQFDKVEMWADVLAYDWVLFCQLFGGAMELPPNVHYIPHDLATLLWAKGIDPDIDREEFAGFLNKAPKHNALHDAIVCRACWVRLMREL